MRAWARALKRDVVALWLAARDCRVDIGVKLFAGAVAAYALSPIDLIPDFIPVLGLLDDLILVPAGIWLAVRMVPPALMSEFRREAARISDRPANPAAVVFVASVWLFGAVATLWWLLAT